MTTPGIETSMPEEKENNTSPSSRTSTFSFINGEKDEVNQTTAPEGEKLMDERNGGAAAPDRAATPGNKMSTPEEEGRNETESDAVAPDGAVNSSTIGDGRGEDVAAVAAMHQMA